MIGEPALPSSDTAQPSLSDASNLLLLLGKHLNPVMSRSMPLRVMLVDHNFAQPDAYLSYLTDTGLLIEDEPSVYKLGRAFHWLTPQRLLNKVPVPSGSHRVAPTRPAASPGPSAGGANETARRYGQFLDKLRSLLSSGEGVPLKGPQSPTNLAASYRIYASVGSVLVQKGFVERKGQLYRQLPGLATLSAEDCIDHVCKYINAARRMNRSAEPPGPAGEITPDILALHRPIETEYVEVFGPEIHAPQQQAMTAFGDALISDVSAVLIDAEAVPDAVIYEPAKPVFSSGIVPRDNEYVVIFPENVQFFPSEAIAQCYAENSVRNDGKKSAIIIHLDPSMKWVRKAIETGTL